jgi:DNA-binding transcriptional ArsR family regulator
LTRNHSVAYSGGVDRLFRALGDPSRLAIVEELRERNDQSLFELCGRLMTKRQISISRQAVSKHIGVLVDAGVVTVDRAGRTTVHHLEASSLATLQVWLNHPTESEDRK